MFVQVWGPTEGGRRARPKTPILGEQISSAGMDLCRYIYLSGCWPVLVFPKKVCIFDKKWTYFGATGGLRAYSWEYK